MTAGGAPESEPHSGAAAAEAFRAAVAALERLRGSLHGSPRAQVEQAAGLTCRAFALAAGPEEGSGCDLAAALLEGGDAARDAFGAAGLALHLEVPEHEVSVAGSRLAVATAIDTLLGAAEAGSAGTEVTVRLRVGGSRAVIELRDNAEGEADAAAWERFFVLPELSLARAVVESLGGVLERPAARQPTLAATLELPLAGIAPAPSAATRRTTFRPPAGGPASRVLVVYEDAATGALVASALARRFEVARASLSDALSVTARGLPDVALLAAPGPRARFIESWSADPLRARVPVLVFGSGEAAAPCGATAAEVALVAPTTVQALCREIAARAAAARVRHEEVRALETSRRQAEAANRAKDEFLSMVSHELRTPLGAILIWTQLLKNERLDEAAAARAVGMIERSTRTLTQIIDDLLDVSRIITGRLRLEMRPVQVGPVLEAAVAGARPTAEAKGVALEVRRDAPLGRVFGDATRLQQVVANLLANAIKFSSAGQRVTVALEEQDGHALVSVTDEGAGIEADLLPLIFERFRRPAPEGGRSDKGLGLGLAIVRHLVETHGGTIEAQSDGEGRGSTFTVTLPLLAADASATAPHAPARSAAGTPLAGVRVLLLDDDDDAREGVTVLLARWGAVVTAVPSVAEGLRALEQAPPSLVVSDIAMPGEDGYSFIRKVRAREGPERQVPAAALTAFASDEDRARAFEAGFDRHIAKPIDPTLLLEALRSLLQPRASERP